MARLDFTEITANGTFGSSATAAVGGDRRYHGFSFYVASGAAALSVYHGTNATGPQIDKVYVSGQGSVYEVRDSGVLCPNGIFIVNDSGTFSHLTIFWQ